MGQKKQPTNARAADLYAKSLLRIADAVYRLRRARKLTQKQMEERHGIAARVVQRVERAEGNINILTLVELATAFGVELDEVVNARGIPRPIPPGRRRD